MISKASPVASHGVYGTTALAGGGGAITITGTASNSSGGGNLGISLASVAAGAATLTLSSTGAVTASGALTASSLRLLGVGGSYTLTNAGNAVGTLAASTGSVNYAQTGNLIVGAVGATTGIAATGSVLVNVAGNLSLAAGTTVTAAGTGTALQLVDSGTFTNLAGAGALGVTGGGRWLVWSVNPATDNRGGLAYGFKQYGATYGVTTPADSTNNGFLYSTGATLTAGLTGTVSKVYDATNLATLAAGNYTVTGAIDGDTITFSSTGSTYNTANVGTGKTVTVTGLSASASNGGATVYGYSVASTTAAAAIGTITAATLTYTANAASRTYGAANPALGGTTTGFMGGDTLGNATTGTSSFTTLATVASNVGSYLITGSGLTANNGNYVFVQAVANSTALAITPATLAYTANAATSIYGSAIPALGGTTTGFVNGQTLATATTGTASFTTLATTASNVGSYLITGSGLVANSGNYVFVQAAANNTALTITPATLTYTANAASSTYGAAIPVLGGTVAGFVNSQTQAIATTGTSSFTTLASSASNVGSYLITGAGLTANNGNYVFVQAAANSIALAITPATLTYAANAATSTYGSSIPALGGTTTGFVNGQTLATATTGTASYSTLATPTSNVGAYLVIGAGLTANNGNYVFVQAVANASALTITPATLTYTANAATSTYGSSIPALGGTVAGFVNGQTQATATTGTASFTTLATTASNVGSYLITGLGLVANSGNYVFAQAVANASALTITPATLTYTANAASSTYGAAIPALNGTTTGFVGSDTLANATTGAASFTTLATAASNVGAYLISGSGLTANNGNYIFAQAPANNTALTITAATLTYTADAASRTYGAVNPVLGGTVTGFVNGQTLASATSGTASFTTLATAASNVGSYLITGAGLLANNGNYTFVQAANNSTALSITSATLTYTADAATRIYGAANPALGGAVTGFVNADTLANATTGTQAFTTLATAASSVGAYLITGSGLVANNGNYVFTQALANNTALTITPATLTYTANAATSTYGAAIPMLSGTTTGFVNGQTQATATTGTATYSTLATPTSNVGAYLVTGTGLVANNGNYVFAQAVANNTALTITPATLTYTANAATSTYGATIPVLGGTVVGFVNGQNQATATTGTASFATLATTASNVGSYMVSGAGLTANNGNYVFAQAANNNNALTITPATLTYTADAASRTYGAANPALGGTVTGFVNSQTQATATTGTMAFATLANAASNVGSYLLSGSGLVANNGNYVFVQAAANNNALTITPATLTYTADAASRTYGAANPALSGTATGFVGSDTLATATTGTSSFTTLATTASNVGSYLVSGSGLTANSGNYVFVQAASNSTALTITPATLTYTADAASRTYGATNPALSGATTGFVNGQTVATATTGSASFTTLASAASNTGTYLITGSGLTANNGNYIFVQAAANNTALTITPATLTYTADAASRTYGAANPALGGAVIGFVNSDTLGNATTGTSSFTTLATAASNVGSYLVSGSGLVANNGNYVFVQAAANSNALTITPATLTYTADVMSRTYGAANPAFSGTTTGFVGSDTQATATTGTSSFTTLATTASNVGSYLVSGSGLTANNGNYVFGQAAANAIALTITPATLTYTADAASRTYGAANPAFSGTVTGFVNSQTQATATTGAASFTTLATTASNVGSYLVSGSGLTANNGNYVFVQAAANAIALTITPATLTYTADAASRTYGAANPTLGGTTTGFVGSDTLANATTGTSSFTTLATAASNVGSYLVSGSGLVANNGNYVFVQAAANNNALTITPATLTYTADAASRTYGAANPALSGTTTGFVGSDTLATATTGAASFTTLATAASNVGSYLISGSGLTANNGNYVFVQAVANNNALTITPATLTYTADAASRTYGAANPALGGTTTGFMGSDTLVTATTGTSSFTTLATTASNVGSYLINGAGLTANNGNYVFIQAAANANALTITPATLTYTADTASRTYGAANPALSGTTTGFMGSDTLANATTGAASFTTLATTGSNVGSYLVSGAGLAANNGNYVFVQAVANNNALTIMPATLTYTADAASRTYGAANPALGGTTTGFVNGQTLATATTGTASFTTLATTASNVGSYLVTGSGLVANNGNYVFVQAAANNNALTVTPATLTYTADAASRTYGAANPAFSGTTTGFVGADTQLSATTGTLAFTTLATAANNVGSYLVSGSGLTANNGNYVFVQAVANITALTITPATLTYTADAASRAYGAANPALSGTVTGYMGSDTLANATTGSASFTTLATAASNTGSYLVSGSGLVANNGNYVFVQAAANNNALTITPATLTYTADAAGRTYGATNPALGGTVTGFVNGQTQATATTGAASFATLANAASNVGSYLVSGSGLLANNGNYIFVQAAANATALTITPATLTYTADAASRTYGAANPAFSGTTSGYMGADTQLSATTGTLAFTTLATAANNVGSYLVSGSGLTANNGNYVFVQAVANNTALTITPATLTYTADAASRTYGAANPAFSGTTSGYMGADTQLSATTGTLAFTTLATAASNVGSYLVSGSGLVANNGNYVFVQAAANAIALTITPATLTYTADAASRTYGAANPAFSGTTTGFVGSDTLANATTGSASFTTLATAASNVGSYLINGAGLAANNGNYVFVQAAANANALTITPATLTYTADAATRTYGAANSALSGTTTGFMGSDTLANATTGAASFTTLATAASNVGSYLVSGAGLAANNGNYVFVQAANNNTALSITPATLTYTADAATRIYGAANLALGGTTTGFVGSDTLGNATTGTSSFTTPATAASNVGSYLISGSGLTANNGNYVFVQATANNTALTINPATLSVSGSKTYDTTTGFDSGQLAVAGGMNGETVTVTGGTGASASANAGIYAGSALAGLVLSVSGGNALASNYVLPAAGTLTIDAATLTYTADVVSRIYGIANPVLSGTVTGFVGGESQASVTTGIMTFSSLAGPGSSGGTYAITGAGLAANNGNYRFVQAAGNSTALTVTQETPPTPPSPPPIPLPTPIPQPPTVPLAQTSFAPPTFSNPLLSTMGSVDIAEQVLNPANDLPMLLTGAEAFVARNMGAIPVEIAEDPRFNGIVACQDPDAAPCRITQ